MSRLLGSLALLGALACLWRDYAAGVLPRLSSLAEVWAALHLDSLIGFQSGLENRLSPDAFLDYVLPVLELPAAPALGALGLLLLALGAALRRRARG
jgi:hypothetical protein